MDGTISLEGAVDLHAHVAPSVFDRRVDGYEHAIEAAEAGLDAVVLKEHHLPTIYGVPFIQRLLERGDAEIQVFGGIVLNYCNGGYNPFAVQSAIEYNSKVVWAPTVDARNHGQKTGGVGTYLNVTDTGDEYRDVDGLYALDASGALKEEVSSCLNKVIENDVILAIGHLSYEETKSMVEYVVDRGHKKVIVDHPNYYITDFDIDQQRELASLGAILNFMFIGLSPKFHYISSRELYENIREIGVDNCVVASDMGQVANPSTPEALRIMGELLLEEGLTAEEYQTMVETTPKRLLGL